MTQEQSHKQSQATTKVVEAFGGARSFAVKLGVAVSLVEHWLARGEIPRDRHAAIRAAAGAEGIALDHTTLDDSAPPPPVIEPDGQPSATKPGEGPSEEAPRPKARPAMHLPPWVKRLAPQLPSFLMGGAVFLVGALIAAGTSNLWLAPNESALPDQRLAAIEEQLTALQAAATQSFDPAVLEGVKAAIKQLEEKVALLDGAALDPSKFDQAIQALSKLEEKVATLELSAGQVVNNPSLDALTTRVAGLEEKLAALLAAQAKNEDLQAQVTNLQERLTALESQAAAKDDAALVERARLALLDTERAVDEGKPFADSATTLTALLGERTEAKDALAVLSTHAAEGVASAQELADDLSERAAAIVAAETHETADEGEEALDSILGLITIRPVGEVEGEGTPERVARAEAGAKSGDLAGAIGELSALPAAPRAVAEEWIARAQARLDALSATALLKNLIGG